MNNLTSKLQEELKNYKLPNLKLADEFIHPNYEGQSILNVPSSVCKLLNVPTLSSPPLREEILSPLGDEIENVIFILVDAMAFHRFQNWLKADQSIVWNNFLENGILAPITSISPSTTAAATSTFWTGAPPSQHGVAGYELWLREYGVTTNMILHKPITYNGGNGNLSMAGFSPEAFLPVEKLGVHLMEHGVEAHAFQHYSISNSGLSQSYLHDAIIHPTSTLPDVWISLREMLKEKQGEKTYSYVYWGDMDGSAHIHGPEAERPRSDFQNFSKSFETYFLSRLTPDLKKGTVVIMGADHGQIKTNKYEDHFDLNNHPEFMQLLHFNPTGENRLAFLHVQPGKIEDVKNYFDNNWKENFTIIESGEALNNGLFGPGPFHKNINSRIGDLMIISKGDSFLWWANKSNPLIGRHGGMSDQEMIVPFLASRLA